MLAKGGVLLAPPLINATSSIYFSFFFRMFIIVYRMFVLVSRQSQLSITSNLSITSELSITFLFYLVMNKIFVTAFTKYCDENL